MKNKIIVHATKQNAKIKVSYYSIVKSFETLFGDVENEEQNLAYMFLQSVAKLDVSVQKKIIQNCVLAGGVTQAKNFVQRFREEVLDLTEKCEEFALIKQKVRDHMAFANIFQPPNILHWTGAKIIFFLQEYDSISISHQQYTDLRSKNQDKIFSPNFYGNLLGEHLPDPIEQQLQAQKTDQDKSKIYPPINIDTIIQNISIKPKSDSASDAQAKKK